MEPGRSVLPAIKTAEGVFLPTLFRQLQRGDERTSANQQNGFDETQPHRIFDQCQYRIRPVDRCAGFSNFAQTIVGGPFTDSSLKGTFAFATINPVENQNKLTEGVITFDGSGTSTGTGESNDSGYLTSGAGISLPYAVAAKGRTTSPASGTTQTLIYIIFGQKLAILDYTAGNANPTMRVAEQ